MPWTRLGRATFARRFESKLELLAKDVTSMPADRGHPPGRKGRYGQLYSLKEACTRRPVHLLSKASGDRLANKRGSKSSSS
jgi:hypothetical protein